MPHSTHDEDKHWLKPVNRIGIATNCAAIGAGFLPAVYLYMAYGEFPPLEGFFAAWGLVLAAFGAVYVVEPISYFPALGTAGTYMGILAGSIGQMRVPAALIAKGAAGVEEDSHEAEIVGTAGIAGSVILSTAVTTATVAAGGMIMAYLPDAVMRTLEAYVLPAMFGAVLALFTGAGRLRVTVATVIAALVLSVCVTVYQAVPLPEWSLMIVTIVIGVVAARVCAPGGRE
ncbi:MAG: hypothetical protein LBR38_06765 [Synergistaceae bacterium]|nr:hypothetical protein [Synergistaceae bacterium]